MSKPKVPAVSGLPVVQATSQPILIGSNSTHEDPLHILHVDDDTSFLQITKMVLETEDNFEIDTATSVDEAFKKMKTQSYDVIVSDYAMPLKNGLDFLKELRKQKNDVPFILFTGKGREEVVVKALNLGADRYINKKGSPEIVYCELADAINKTTEQKKSRMLLAESESKYRTLVEKSVQGILILQTAPPRIVFANKPMEKIFGYSPEELKSLSPEEVTGLIYPEDKAFVFKRIENTLLGETAKNSAEFRAVRKNGSIVWVEVFSNRIEYLGKPALQSMFLDITERKKAGEILRESEQKYRELANSLPDIVFETDSNGRIIFANERAPEISGYSFSELEKGLNILEFLAPEDRERATKNIHRLLAGGIYAPSEYTFVRKNGTTFPALITATPRISKNQMVGLRGMVLDITDRKKAEEKVKKSEERYRELANFLPEIVFEADLVGKITFFSQRAFEITGFTLAELEKGLNMLSFVVPEEREKAKENMKKSIEGENIGAHEYTLFRKDGSTYPALVRTSPIICEKKVTGLRGLVIDITERKKVEASLRESEEKFRNLAEESPNMIFINRRGRVVYANKKCEDITGYAKEEFYSPDFDFLTLHAPENFEVVTSSYSKHLRGENVPPYEFVLVTRDGKRINTIITTKLIEYEKEKAILGIVTDLTDRKKKDFELKAEKNKLEAMTQSVGAGFVVVSKDYHVLWANKFIKEYKGDVEGKLCYSTLNDLDHICPDCGVKKVFENGASLDSHEYSSVNIKGNPYWVELIATPIKDGEGNVISAAEIAVDITEKKTLQSKLAEYSHQLEKLVEERTKQLKETQAQLVKSERLAAIGELAGMVGHDLRNPLTGIKNAAFFLKKKGANISEVQAKEMLEIIDKSIEHSNKIINDLLDYAREMHLELRESSIHSLLSEALKTLKVPDNIQIFDLTSDEPKLRVDLDKIERVFQNLIKNALEAMPKGGMLNVKSNIAQGNVEIAFSDTGAGIPEEVLSQIFTPLFTTKAQGMGFGLSICKRVVEAHGGTISVKTDFGKGTTFTISLPINNSLEIKREKE